MDCVPTPNNLVVMWTFNGAEISRLQAITFTPTNLNHALTIHRADVNNTGQYTCHLIQSFNTAISRTITLEVIQSMFIYIIATFNICMYVRIRNYVYAYNDSLCVISMDTCMR